MARKTTYFNRENDITFGEYLRTKGIRQKWIIGQLARRGYAVSAHRMSLWCTDTSRPVPVMLTRLAQVLHKDRGFISGFFTTRYISEKLTPSALNRARKKKMEFGDFDDEITL